MLFMVIEHFKKDATLIYQQLRDSGRMFPSGLHYVTSWVDVDLQKCFQVMETDQRELLDQWIANWRDLADFEVIEVMSSDDAREKALSSS